MTPDEQPAPVVASIETAEVADLVAAGGTLLVDAQAPGFFEREHLPGAVPVDWDDLPGGFSTQLPDRATPIVVYCWNEACSGSAAVADALLRHGYTDVRTYPGGKAAWQAAGHRIDGAAAVSSAATTTPSSLPQPTADSEHHG